MYAVDKAGAPENLSLGEVWASNVLLRWEPPKDDGGYEITHYTIEMCEAKSLAWSKAGKCPLRFNSDQLIVPVIYTINSTVGKIVLR